MQAIISIFGAIIFWTFIAAAFPAVGHFFEFIFGLVIMGVFLFVGGVIIVALVRGAAGAARWADYTFVKHPAEPIVSPALREGRELDTAALHDALIPRQGDLALSKPVYHYEHQAEKARAMSEKLNADAELAQAAMRRERARAALQDAEREFEEARRRSKG